MGLIEIEREDTVIVKDGRSIRVMAVYKTGKQLHRIEGVDDNEPIPTRRPFFFHDIVRVIKREKKKEVK